MPPTLDPSPRRWFRFSLRALMVLVLVVGGGMGWLVHGIGTQRAAIAAVEAAGGMISYDYDRTWTARLVAPGPDGRQEPAAPAWARRWLGDELFQSVQGVVFEGAVTAEIGASLARFDRLEELYFMQATRLDVDLRHLRGLRHLRYLKLDDEGATDAILGEVAQLLALEHLETYAPAATDAGFAHLAALPNLAKLEIRSAPNLTDAGVATMVAGMPRLESLSLIGSGAQALPLTLRALSRHHPGLKELDLSDGGLADADLAPLGGLGGLTTLDISATRVTDAASVHLRRLARLTSLDLGTPGITDAGLPALGGLAALRRLSFRHARVTDAGLAHLAQLPLAQLDLSGTLVTDAGMTAVARLAGLEHLDIDHLPGLTDAGLTPLHGLPKLRSIGLDGARTNGPAFRNLLRAVPSLTQFTESRGP